MRSHEPSRPSTGVASAPLFLHPALRRLAALAVASLLAGALGAASARAQQAADAQKHMLWEVSTGEGTAGYLVGSVHYMKSDAYPLDSIYDRAFESADALAFEVNLDSAQTDAQTLLQEYGTYRGEQSLQDALPDSTWAALRSRLGELGLPAARMGRFEPWAVALTVTALQVQRAGYSPQSGIDRHFFDRAGEAGKAIVALETAEEQIKIFDGLPADLQAAFLRHSLREAERMVQEFDDMVAAWRAGDTGRLMELLRGEMHEKYPGLYRTLLVERNRNWMPQITEMLEGDRLPMIVVGAGHVPGEGGLAAMLREQGYTVEQL